jgi:hypothetical protein
MLLVCFFGGFIPVITAIITMNIYVTIVGLIMFAIGEIAASWEQGVHEAKYARGHGSNNHWNDYYMNRCGSYQAKKNMR